MATTDSDGNVFYDDGDLNIVGPFGDTLFSNDPAGDTTTFGGAIADLISHGVLNGDFSQGPGQGVGTSIGSNNPMPYWTGPWVASGNSIDFTWASDSSSPSLYNLRATISAGAASDEAYVEQIVTIGGSRKQWVAYFPRLIVNVVASSIANQFQFYLRYQFMTRDDAPVGSVTTLSFVPTSTTGLFTTPMPGQVGFPTIASPPSTAYKVAYRIGVKRHLASDTDTATIDFVDIRSDIANAVSLLPDNTDPVTYNPGFIYQRNGVIYLQLAAFPSGVIAASAANIKIGGVAARGTTEAAGALYLFNSVAPVGTLTNGVTLYSASGELRVMDSGGVSTLLSPHDDDNYWVFDSEDTETGEQLHIDVEKLLRFVNDHFGLAFIKGNMTRGQP